MLSEVQDNPVGWRWLSGLLVVLLLIAVGWVAFGWGGFQRQSLPERQEAGDLGVAYQAMQVASGSQKGSWMRTLSPVVEDVQGDLVWNNDQQQGVMRFLNLPDPARGFRYHVWIHDSRSQDDQAVSGALLDKGSGEQELFVRIQAAEPVTAPYKFVLTLEPLSGSAGAQVLLMAQP